QQTPKMEIFPNFIRMGKLQVDRFHPSSEALVPSTFYMSIPSQDKLLKDLLQDILLGFPLLLIGNQGVGKNKIGKDVCLLIQVDYLLGSLRAEREYVQLHRDTSVYTLTATPSLS